MMNVAEANNMIYRMPQMAQYILFIAKSENQFSFSFNSLES